jgi:arylsulfatase A-like enzyme
LFPPKRYFDSILNRDLPKPARGDWVEWDKLSPQGNLNARNRVRLEGEPLRRAQAAYYGLIEHIDAEILALVIAFKSRSEKAGRPCVIVIISDHGEMLGDHGYFRKCEPYEGSTNVPFIIAGSKDLGLQPGIRSHHLAALEDIMPTLLALAGVKTPPAVDGISLLPALRDAKQPTRDILHLEHAPTYTKEQAFHSLTDGHFKYIWRPSNGKEQLFNLDTDPREERDLSKLPIMKEWRHRLIQRLAGRPEGFTDGKTLIPGRPYMAIR